MVEEFDYLNSDVSELFNKALAVRSGEMFDREVAERAKLLYNLHYGLAEATARIKCNIEWEFDDSWTNNRPQIHARIDKVVKELYARMKEKRD